MDVKLKGSAAQLLLASALLFSSPALAQMPDYCSAPLAAKDGPQANLDWLRLCTIQKLQAERVYQADRATQDEVEIAKLRALMKTMQAELDKAKQNHHISRSEK